MNPMSERVIGVVPTGSNATEMLDSIGDLERRGIQAAWLTGGGTGIDTLTLFAAAAVRTERIQLGTSIVPTWPRHPITAVQQVQVLAQLAEGRFRLGVGPSHKPSMERTYGFDFRAPLSNLREYITIVKSLLDTGQVEFDGRHYHANASLAAPVPGVPVMASALRPGSFEMCGEIADGAISWVCPSNYLREIALPAMKKGAKKAGRPTPPLIAHTPICLHDDPEVARESVRAAFSRYATIPFYAMMFETAGFPEPLATGEWTDAMTEAVALTGTKVEVADQLRERFEWGVGEALVSIVPAINDAAVSRERTLDFLEELAKE
jgi:F420-dependent oxidoreductase-like protein